MVQIIECGLISAGDEYFVKSQVELGVGTGPVCTLCSTGRGLDLVIEVSLFETWI